MKFAAVALLAAAAVSVDAQSTLPSCASTVIRPWILSSQPPASLCLAAAGFRGNPYAVPTDAIKATFCAAPDCLKMLDAVYAAKPATGDCSVRVNNVPTDFYAGVIDKYAEICGVTAPTPAPSTTAPSTTAPPTPQPTTVAPTTTPPTTAAPTVTPMPTTARPQC